jgi:hypothetical protein
MEGRFHDDATLDLLPFGASDQIRKQLHGSEL